MSRSQGGSVRRGLLSAVRFYQRAVSPALPPRCRFHPTCSAYAAEAIEVHGAARGSALVVRRILKCAPWHPGGVDLVPPSPRVTADPGSASGTGAAAAPDMRVHPSTPPATSRSPQQEAGVV